MKLKISEPWGTRLTGILSASAIRALPNPLLATCWSATLNVHNENVWNVAAWKNETHNKCFAYSSSQQNRRGKIWPKPFISYQGPGFASQNFEQYMLWFFYKDLWLILTLTRDDRNTNGGEWYFEDAFVSSRRITEREFVSERKIIRSRM